LAKIDAWLGGTLTLSSRNRLLIQAWSAKVTQSDIARAIRDAKSAGAREVTVDSDGVIRIVLAQGDAAAHPTTAAGDEWTPSEALRRHLNGTENGCAPFAVDEVSIGS
jgi:hypothetical protein